MKFTDWSFYSFVLKIFLASVIFSWHKCKKAYKKRPMKKAKASMQETGVVSLFIQQQKLTIHNRPAMWRHVSIIQSAMRILISNVAWKCFEFVNWIVIYLYVCMKVPKHFNFLKCCSWSSSLGATITENLVHFQNLSIRYPFG